MVFLAVWLCLSSSHHDLSQINSGCTQQCPCFCRHKVGAPIWASRWCWQTQPSSWGSPVTQRGSQHGPGDAFRPLMLKTVPTLMHISNLPPPCPQGEKWWACYSSLLREPFKLPFLSGTFTCMRIYCQWQWQWGVGNGLGRSKRHALASLYCPDVDSVWMAQAPHVWRNDPGLSIFYWVRKAIGEEAW